MIFTNTSNPMYIYISLYLYIYINININIERDNSIYTILYAIHYYSRTESQDTIHTISNIEMITKRYQKSKSSMIIFNSFDYNDNNVEDSLSVRSDVYHVE